MLRPIIGYRVKCVSHAYYNKISGGNAVTWGGDPTPTDFFESRTRVFIL